MRVTRSRESRGGRDGKSLMRSTKLQLEERRSGVVLYGRMTIGSHNI